MARHEGLQGTITKAAFGARNRARLIQQYLAENPAIETPAWKHVYRLLLWIDQTTGLAHCYESDKSQPGKPWYGRSLAFHDWAASQFRVEPIALAEEVDWLFRHATADLAYAVLQRAQKLLETASRQRQPFFGREFPSPGEDPELIRIVRDVLGDHLTGDVTPETWQLLVQRLRQYLTLENKRRNLVGEGFEDVVAAIIRRADSGSALDVRTRQVLHDLPGFNPPRQGDKPNKVDVAIIRRRDDLRMLVTAKWSIRADRERQFPAEYSEYVQAEKDRRPFEYVLVTNEFDPARLMRACEFLAANQYMFTRVVHINPAALQATYGLNPREASMKQVLQHIESGRLLSLDDWLSILLKAVSGDAASVGRKL